MAIPLPNYSCFDSSMETPAAACGRRHWLAAVAWSVTAMVPRPGASAQADDAFSEAAGVLERERSAAEQYAVILATVGRRDVGNYVRGIQLYADAKAEFDGLIAQLRLGLINGSDPVHAPKFAATLQAAAEKRIAFTNFVSVEVVDKIQGARPGLIDVAKAVPELVKALTDAGLGIWGAFRDANKQHREAILSEIDHLRWRAFADLAPKQSH
jgi:hypothetical protein